MNIGLECALPEEYEQYGLKNDIKGVVKYRAPFKATSEASEQHERGRVTFTMKDRYQ